MREFFHGWRRKTGCVTLAMACLLASLWIRSTYSLDYVSIPIGENDVHLIGSLDSSLGWQWTRDVDSRNLRKLTWGTHRLDLDRQDQNENSEWRWAGFAKGRLPTGAYWLVPYWFLVIPLTLLSSYLLLWKPGIRIL